MTDVRALREIGETVRERLTPEPERTTNPDGVHICPIRDCAGGEGPHDALFHGPGTWLPESGACE